jgi:hypothetical protein
MDLDIGKIWLGGAGLLIGAIAGGAIWAQRAAGIAEKAARAAGEDALMVATRTIGTSSLAAAIQGAIGGAIIGLILAVAYMYFTDPDREMVFRKVEVNDRF